MGILKEESRRILKKSWNSERSLIFDHVILTKILGICQDREIRARISSQKYLWERVVHAILVGDA